MKKLPDELNSYLRGELEWIGGRLLGRSKAETPVRTGGLRNALAAKVTPKSLVLKLGLITKATRRRFFYGYILDQGRSAKVVMRMSRRSREAWNSRIAARSASARRRPKDLMHPMRVSPIDRERYNFVFGRRRDFINEGLPRLRAALERVLRRVSRGVGDD